MHTTPPIIISAIVAMTENRVIGKNNRLPWRLPADLQHFKTITMGHPILMGRKTYESIGKPLPGRMNIIMTRNRHFNAPGCLLVSSLAEATQQAAKVDNATNSLKTKQEIFLIGGAEIYRQLLPFTEKIYLTLIHHAMTGDTYFPALNQDEWKEIERVSYPADQDNVYPYSFIILQRLSHTR